MLAAFLIGIILLIFGIVSENAKAAELNNRHLRQAKETEIALINGAVHATRRVNSYGSPGHTTRNLHWRWHIDHIFKYKLLQTSNGCFDANYWSYSRTVFSVDCKLSSFNY